MKESRRRRWLRRLLWAAGAGTLLFASFVAWALLTCFAEPPELDGEPAVLALERTTNAAGRLQLGASWFERREGASLLYLEGDPFTLGYSNATLTAEYLAQPHRLSRVLPGPQLIPLLEFLPRLSGPVEKRGKVTDIFGFDGLPHSIR